MKNLKKILIPVALAVTMSLSAFLVACGKEEDNPDPGPGPVTPTEEAWHNEKIWLEKNPLVPTDEAVFPEDINFNRTTNGSVHDPSIFEDPVSGAYYAYGTHYAVAKTYSLSNAYMNTDDGGWEQVTSDNDFSIFGGTAATYGGLKYPSVIEETINLVKPTNNNSSASTWSIWAPDVEYINGKYYLYYSLTKEFGSRESAIGRVEADSPEGPFENNKIIVNSIGGSGLDPNCIDSELFYDKDGNLYMVYGSSTGGIYVLDLEKDGENVGLPKAGQGFGTRVWRQGNNVEGPFIYYNASTEYYYLMTSYNSLMSNYNMHVARSTSPKGPFVGIDGKDVAVDGDGNLVSGNFQLDRNGKGVSPFAAMGHNSVIKDKDGKYYAVYHARRISVVGNATQGTVGSPHLIYVSQIYFNEDGWPVMSPTPCVGETRGTMTNEQVATSYDVVLHERPTTIDKDKNIATFVKSAAYTLTADGKVTGTGTATDSWTLKDGYYIELTVKGVTYKGVVAPGWDTYVSGANQKAVVTITAVSATGQSLWAVQK